MIAVCEGLLYGYKAGLKLDEMVSLLSNGAGTSFSLTKYCPRQLQRNFEPGFYVEHFVKDLTICLEEARRMNLALPGLALASQLYNALQGQGGARMGTQGLLTALEKMNGVTVDTYTS